MWHAIIAFGQHTGSNDVKSGMPSSPLGSKTSRTTSDVACHHRRWTSSHSRTVSGVACRHRSWTKNAVEQRWVWHAIIAFGQHTRSTDVGRGMAPSPLGSTNGQTSGKHAITALGLHRRSDYIGCVMTSPPLDSTNDRTTSGVACHHRLWAAHTVE